MVFIGHIGVFKNNIAVLNTDLHLFAAFDISLAGKVLLSIVHLYETRSLGHNATLLLAPAEGWVLEPSALAPN